MLGDYHLCRQKPASERSYSAEAVVLDPVGFEAFNESVHSAVRQFFKEELLAVRMGEVVETDMYFINTADGDYIVYLLCGFPGFKQKRSGRSAVDRFYKSLDLADGFEIRQHDNIGLAGENAFEFIRKAVKKSGRCVRISARF